MRPKTKQKQPLPYYAYRLLGIFRPFLCKANQCEWAISPLGVMPDTHRAMIYKMFQIKERENEMAEAEQQLTRQKKRKEIDG